MNDLLLVENIKAVKEYRLILCGTNPLSEIIADWLDGSGLSVTRLIETEELSGLDEDENLWFFLPNDAIDDWQEDIVSLCANRKADVKTSTLGAFHYALTICGVQLFEDKNKALIEGKIRQEKMNTIDGFLQYMTFVVLSDHDVDEMKEVNPVLAYGTGKVGTTSMYDSLLAAKIPARHLHAISGEKIINTIRNHPNRVKILCGVREPLARDLSLFFQAESSFDRYLTRQGNFEQKVQKMVTNVYKVAKYYFGLEPSPYGLEFGWFDKEFKENFGLDIFETPFDKEKGYTIYHKDSIDLFLYRLEDLNGLETAIQEFLGRPEFKLLHTNNAMEKNIAYIYSEFKKKYRFPDSHIRLYYEDNERMDYFYSKEEQEAFLKKWNITER